MVKDYKNKHNVYMSLKQNAKVAWLKDVDDNSAVFH